MHDARTRGLTSCLDLGPRASNFEFDLPSGVPIKPYVTNGYSIPLNCKKTKIAQLLKTTEKRLPKNSMN